MNTDTPAEFAPADTVTPPWYRVIGTPLLSLALFSLGSGLVITLISLTLHARDASDAFIGILHSIYYIGLVLGALKTENLIIKVGHIRAFSAFTALVCSTILILGFSNDPIAWMAARFVCGYCTAGLYVAIEGWLLAAANPTNRGQYLALYMVALYASQALSQYILPFFPPMETGWYLFSACLISLGGVPVLLTQYQAPDIVPVPPIPFWSIVRQAPLGALGNFVAGFCLAVFYAFLPIFAQESGRSVAQAMGSLVLGGMLLQPVIGKISDMFDRRLVLCGIAAISCVPVLFLSQSHWGPWTYRGFCFLVGGGLCAIYPVSVSRILDCLEGSRVLSATAFALCAYSIGSIAGPLFAGLLIQQSATTESLFYLVIAVLGALTVAGTLGMIFQRGTKLEDQEPNTSLPRTSPIANQLDPRT